MKWKILKQEILLDNRWLKAVDNLVELPDGKNLNYVTLPAAANAACVIVVDRKGKILLQKEYSLGADEVMYQLPGGSIFKGEEPSEAAVRELQEESGYIINNLSPLGWFYTDNRRSNQRMYVFKASGISKTVKTPDIGEFISNHWFEINEINTMIKTGAINNPILLAAWALFCQK